MPQVDSCHTSDRAKERRFFPRQWQEIPTWTILYLETREFLLCMTPTTPPQLRPPPLPWSCTDHQNSIPKETFNRGRTLEEVFAVSLKAPGNAGPKHNRWLDSTPSARLGRYKGGMGTTWANRGCLAILFGEIIC